MAERLLEILDLLHVERPVPVAELASRLDVSPMTVRRDLDELVRRGLVQRVHGAARLARAREPGFAARVDRGASAKQRIAAATATLLEPGETVVLDAGTTALAVARALPRDAELTVCALSVQALSELWAIPGLTVLTPGGHPRPGEGALTGSLAVASLSALHPDSFVMAVGGVDAVAGFTDYALDDVAVKQTVLARTRRTVVVADRSKLAAVTFVTIAPLGAATILVTDAPEGDPALAPVLEAGVRVVHA